jgi:hypothetical protein
MLSGSVYACHFKILNRLAEPRILFDIERARGHEQAAARNPSTLRRGVPRSKSSARITGMSTAVEPVSCALTRKQASPDVTRTNTYRRLMVGFNRYRRNKEFTGSTRRTATLSCR